MTSQPEQNAPRVPAQPTPNGNMCIGYKAIMKPISNGNMCIGYKAIMKPISNGNMCIGYNAGYALAPSHIPKSKNRFIRWLDHVIERWLTA